MVEDDGVVDVADHLAVVVDDDDVLAGVEDRLRLEDVLDVGVADDEQRLAGDSGQRVLRLEEHPLESVLEQPLIFERHEVGAPADDDVGVLAHEAGGFHDAHRRAEAVEIGGAVPMTSTLSLPEISSASAVATMRVLTLVRFSMPLETPPKNS